MSTRTVSSTIKSFGSGTDKPVRRTVLLLGHGATLRPYDAEDAHGEAGVF